MLCFCWVTLAVNAQNPVPTHPVDGQYIKEWLVLGPFFSADLDRDAEFPFEDYQDLRSSGLLALCVPEEYGGHGAGFETYCLVSEQLAQGNSATALTFNMHCLVMLMMGPFMEGLDLPPEVWERHQILSARRYREVVEQGVFYGQPHSGIQDGRWKIYKRVIVLDSNVILAKNLSVFF